MSNIHQVEVRMSKHGMMEATYSLPVELEDPYCFWLAYMAKNCTSKPHVWYNSGDPWIILVQKGLLHVLDSLPDYGDGTLHKYALTSKGEQLLQVVDPAPIVDMAVYKELYTLAAEWMSLLSPEHLPSYLSHESETVRQMALARTRFIREWETTGKMV